MCLSNVKKTFKENDNMKVGYKLFFRSIRDVNAYFSPVYKTSVPRYLGREYNAGVGAGITAGSNQRYEVGFHIWSTLKGAKLDLRDLNEVIVKVIAWDIRACGQNRTSAINEINRACFVAKNIRLMEEI